MGDGAPDGAGFVRALAVHSTDHVTAPQQIDGDRINAGPSIQAVFRDLVEDEARSRQKCADIVAAARAGRNCLVLSQWTEHLTRLAAQVEALGLVPDLLWVG